jgi:hypothetical protein
MLLKRLAGQENTLLEELRSIKAKQGEPKRLGKRKQTIVEALGPFLQVCRLSPKPGNPG